ncbi:AAA family ATPase [Streptomyces griseorubiginosus]|uniref:AAA family ATPase n=1 Tax=Streptomyces griseorubiginosus TaxID=67304 RepID=UPI001AD7A3BF|nr:AAA family ATPase [Streptomyces griseorubiginosus]MBO4253519.1 AAA family ATPase [Streptomyces griseorubiginosus]
MRIAVVGAYGAGKTTLIRAATARTGLPAAHGTPMRDPHGSRPKPLEEASESELIQLVVRRHAERLLAEAAHPEGFLSDGSLLHEWVYATVRLAVGLHPGSDRGPQLVTAAPDNPYRSVLDHLGREFLHRALASYDAFVHLPVAFPLHDDPPPIGEHFRTLSDRLLLDTLHSSGAAVHTITGGPEERLDTLLDLTLPAVRAR